MALVRKRRVVVQLVVFLVLWGFITHGTYAGSGDEPHYLAIAHSLAFDRDLDLSNNYGANEPLIAGGELEPGLHVRRGGDGRVRPVHDLGLPAAFAPYVLVARPVVEAIVARAPASLMRRARLTPSVLYRHVLSMGMMVVAVLLAGLLFDTFNGIAGRSRATWWTLLIMLSPPALAYGVLFFTEFLTALVAFVVIRSLSSQAPRKTGAWFALGCGTAFLLLVHARNIGLVAGLAAAGAAIASRSEERGALPAFAGGVAPLIAVRTALNAVMWGTLVTGPHASPSPWPGWNATLGGIARRLTGLGVDQEYGLLVYAPIFILAPFGWRALRRQEPRFAWLAALAMVSYLLPVLVPSINRHGWTGGWCPPGRFVMPIVPLLAVFVVSASTSASRLLVVPLVTLQVALSALFWNQPKLLWNDGDGRAAICDALPPRACGLLPSLVEPSDKVQ